MRRARSPTAARLERGRRARGSGRCRASARPHYTNVVMPFDDPPPNVPEQNETGIYRRTFTLPRGWRSPARRAPLRRRRGRAVRARERRSRSGSRKDARTPAEFDISELVHHDVPNELVAVVVRWSDASFVEDQDQWWQAGLPRSIRLVLAERARRRGSHARRRDGRLYGDAGADGDVRLLDARGRVVATGELDDGRFERRGSSAARCGRPSSRRSTRSSCSAGGETVSMRGRLPARRGARPPAARQRRAGADRRRQPPRARRHARSRDHARVDGARRRG